MPSKFHSPSTLLLPLCSRQLSSTRPESAQDQRGMQVAGSPEEFLALLPRRQCRHCLRALGRLPAVSREVEMSSAVEELLEANQEERDESR